MNSMSRLLPCVVVLIVSAAMSAQAVGQHPTEQMNAAVPQAASSPKDSSATNLPSRFVDSAVGLSMVLAEGWQMESQASGRYSDAPKVTFTPASSEPAVTAMVALSRILNERSWDESHERFVTECVRSVEKAIRKQSRKVTKTGEQRVTIAGVEGIRLDLLTETPSGMHLRRWINVFSNPRDVVMVSQRGGIAMARPCGYVVAATAREAEFDRYLPAFNAMIESVQFSGKDSKN